MNEQFNNDREKVTAWREIKIKRARKMNGGEEKRREY